MNLPVLMYDRCVRHVFFNTSRVAYIVRLTSIKERLLSYMRERDHAPMT